LIPLFSHPSPEEKLKNEEDVSWDCEEIRLKGIEADFAELKSEINRHGIIWHAEGKSNKIDGEHVP
jgi:hypothetical protein